MVGGFWNRHVIRLASYDADIDEMTDEGIHICIAAGK